EVSAERLGCGVPSYVVNHEEIEPAVVVVIEPAGGHGPGSAALEPSLFGNILERAVAAVAIEDVPAHTGDKKIRMAVAIEVARRDAHGVASAGHAGGRRHIGKRAIVTVTK